MFLWSKPSSWWSRCWKCSLFWILSEKHIHNVSSLFLVTKVLNGLDLTEMIIINHNLGFHNLRPVQTSSMTSPTHHCSVHNRLLEFGYDVGVGQYYGGSTLAFLISVVKKIHCNVILTRYCQFQIATLFIPWCKWCLSCEEFGI